MRNTYVIAAVLAMGLVAPVAFLAGQYVSQQYERSAGKSPNQGDGGNGLTGLPGGGGPNATSFSFGISQPSNVYGGVRIEGGIRALGDPEADGKHFREVVMAEHKQEIMLESILVPPGWDGMLSGERVHNPLAAVDGHDVSSPRLFLAISYGEEDEVGGTRAMNAYLKLGAIVEPGAVMEVSGLEETDDSVGGRIWVNVSLNYAKIQLEEYEEVAFSAYIELPGTWMSTLSTTDKSSPLLLMAVGAHPDVAAMHDDAEFAADFTMVFEEDATVVFGPFPHIEEVSFTFRKIEITSWNIEANKKE